MKLVASFILLLACLTTTGQATRNWIDSEVKYTDSKGNLVKLIHSFPKGGGQVYHNGKKYSYVVFWTRVFNQSATPIELQIKFPEVNYFKSPESYIKIVLPKETMNIDKVQLFDYGLTNLQSLVDDKSNQLSMLQKKISPKEDYLFYLTVFIHTEGNGPSRSKFELKNKNFCFIFSNKTN